VKIRVVKVGGSLFDLPDLTGVLRHWLAEQSPACHILIPGGGPMADFIRTVDRRLRLNAEDVHWACIAVLTASTRLLAAMLPEASFVEDFGELRRRIARERGLLVFDVEHFLRSAADLRSGLQLPCGWQVTSDSIAAFVADATDADELVLLKSTELPAGSTRSAAAFAGLVDSFFPQASSNVDHIRWVNLRGQSRERHLPR
jgi:aspartokinase-like uncharacterized kinase